MVGRQSCGQHTNLCGDCLPTLTGEKGPSNLPCIDQMLPSTPTCPTNVTVTGATSALLTPVSFVLPAGEDNSGVASVTSSVPSGSGFPVGTTLVQVTVMDYAGLSASCRFAVTVTPAPLEEAFDSTAQPRVLSGAALTLARQGFWDVLLAGDFVVEWRAATRGPRSPAVLLGNEPGPGAAGLRLGGDNEETAFTIEYSDGERVVSRTFQIPPPSAGAFVTYLVRHAIGLDPRYHYIALFVDATRIDGFGFALGVFWLPDSAAASVVLGPSSAPFVGSVAFLRIAQMDACQRFGCDVRALCTLDPTDFRQRTCPCRPGFMPPRNSSGSNERGEACEPTERSCKTCSDLSWPLQIGERDATCALPRLRDTCLPPQPYAAAEVDCHRRGGRMCTAGEVGMAPTGNLLLTLCQLAETPLWTKSQDGCGDEEHLVRGASAQSQVVAACVKDTDARAYMCCADRGEYWASEHSCAALGWPGDNAEETVPVETEAVCAASQLAVDAQYHASRALPPRCVTATWYDAETTCAALGARLCETWELAQGEATSTACNLNTALVWTAGECTAQTARARGGGRDVVLGGGCLPKTTLLGVRCCADAQPQPPPAPPSAKACEQLKWDAGVDGLRTVCGYSPVECASPGDGSPAPRSERRVFFEAEAQCRALGARLCTYGELVGGEAAGSGCLYDAERVWSSTPCRNCTLTGYLTHAGGPTGRALLERECLSMDNDVAFVRCCADEAVECNAAGNGDGDCAALRREPCVTKPQTCGACVAGFAGSLGPSNVADCRDVQPPRLRCPAGVTVEVAASVRQATVQYAAPQAADNVGLRQVQATRPSGSVFPFGLTLVTVTATDLANNTAQCNFTVRVVGPSQCPAGQSDVALNQFCEACPNGTFVAKGAVGDCDRFRCPVGTIDHDFRPSTPCQPCDGFTGFQDAVGQITCTPVTVCAAGTGEAKDASPTTDRVCVKCAAGFFSAQAGDACQRVATCAIGEEEAVAPTAVSDRSCRPCSPNTYQDTPGQLACKAVSVPCGVAAEEVTAATATSDRRCAACQEGWYKSDAAAGPCRLCTTSCPAGRFLTACQPGRNAECRACPTGTFSSRSDDTACQPVLTVCPPGQFLLQLGNATHQSVCAACSTCAAGTHATGGCNGVVDTTCTACVQPAACAGNQYYDGTCLATQREGPRCQQCDVTCASCVGARSDQCLTCDAALRFDPTPGAQTGRCVSRCDAGKYYSEATAQCADCPAASGCAECKGPAVTDCLACAAGMYLQDGACTSTCGAGSSTHYLDAQTGMCLTCTACRDFFYEAAACTASSDRECLPETTCDADEYEAEARTRTSDRRCERCAACQAGYRAVVGSCGAANNTRCQPCEAGTFAERAGETSCQVARDCAAGEYELEAPTRSSDRSCAPCPAGAADTRAQAKCDVCLTKGLYVPPGSFGACEDFPCREGTADVDGLASTPCQRCDGITAFQASKGQASCMPASLCAAGSFQVAALTRFSDRICAPCDGVTGYQDTENTAIACKAVQQCDASTAYEVQAATATQNRACAPLTPCKPEEYEHVAPGPTSDRRCSPATVCGSERYETRAMSASMDRVCSPLTQCRVGVEDVPATTTSDRRCRVEVLLGFAGQLAPLQAAGDDVTFSSALRNETQLLGIPQDAVAALVLSGDIAIVATVVVVDEPAAVRLQSLVRRGKVTVTFTRAGGVVYSATAYDPQQGPPATRSSSSSSSDLGVPMTIVIVLAVLLLLAVVSIAVVLRRRRRREGAFAMAADAAKAASFENPMYNAGASITPRQRAEDEDEEGGGYMESKYRKARERKGLLRQGGSGVGLGPL